MFSNSTIGLLLLLTHILSSISVGICFRFYKSKNKNKNFNNTYKNKSNTKIYTSKTLTISNLGEVLGDSIMSAIKTIVLIGGFVVFFNVILSILGNSNLLTHLSNIVFPIFKIFKIDNIKFPYGLLKGLLEITNGISYISSIPYKKISINILISAFLLGFGGLSVLFQVYAIISKANISIKPYFIGKLLQGIFATIYTYILLKYIPIFNFNL